MIEPGIHRVLEVRAALFERSSECLDIGDPDPLVLIAPEPKHGPADAVDLVQGLRRAARGVTGRTGWPSRKAVVANRRDIVACGGEIEHERPTQAEPEESHPACGIASPLPGPGDRGVEVSQCPALVEATLPCERRFLRRFGQWADPEEELGHDAVEPYVRKHLRDVLVEGGSGTVDVANDDDHPSGHIATGLR